MSFILPLFLILVFLNIHMNLLFIIIGFLMVYLYLALRLLHNINSLRIIIMKKLR